MYSPSERTNITWPARNRSWRHYPQVVRDVASDFPAAMRGLRLADLPDHAAGRSVAKWAKRWGAYPSSGLSLEAGAERPRRNRGAGLWLYGPPGHGKTTMAAAAAQHVSDLGWSTKFISAANLYELNKQAFGEHDDDAPLSGAASACEHWDGWRLLVLDDLGKEYHAASGFAANLFDRVIRNRYTSAAPTIVTTNLRLSDVAVQYNESMASYINEAFWKVAVTDKDHR